MNYSLIITFIAFAMAFTFIGTAEFLFSKSEDKYRVCMVLYGFSAFIWTLFVAIDFCDDKVGRLETAGDIAYLSVVCVFLLVSIYKNSKLQAKRDSWITEDGHVTVAELKDNLEALVERGEGGKEIVVQVYGQKYWLGKNVGVGSQHIYLG